MPDATPTSTVTRRSRRCCWRGSTTTSPASHERAIGVWTRVLFLDRGHARARAYIERARSAVAERQRESEELLHRGVAAFDRGETEEARRLLTSAVERGGPQEVALAFLDRLDRLEATPVAADVSAGAADRGATGAAPPAPGPARSRRSWVLPARRRRPAGLGCPVRRHLHGLARDAAVSAPARGCVSRPASLVACRRSPAGSPVGRTHAAARAVGRRDRPPARGAAGARRRSRRRTRCVPRPTNCAATSSRRCCPDRDRRQRSASSRVRQRPNGPRWCATNEMSRSAGTSGSRRANGAGTAGTTSRSRPRRLLIRICPFAPGSR